MIRIENIKIREDISEEEVVKQACLRNKINFGEVKEYSIFKKSIDARDKEDIYYNYAVNVKVVNEKKYKRAKIVSEKKDTISIKKNRISNKRPVIVGAGPAGLFCALTLVNNGLKPVIIEQGKKVEERKKDVDEFLKTGRINVNSNVQFGEGGAGTFSDGKLTTGLNNEFCKTVINEFVKFGAPNQISYESKPHIGTDNLVKIIANMRNYIIEKGGTFLFDEKVTDFEFTNGKVTAVICSKKIETDTVILAIGHSARDTFEILNTKKVYMEKKNFSVGVRIEHKQEMINKLQYGTKTKFKLPVAEYKLAYHGEDGRSSYTFCMCPGGTVIASSSEVKAIVTNGMSLYARNGENANSALLVNISPEDFPGESVLEGIYFQKELEEKAFILGGANYNAPIQRVEDFLNDVKTEKIGNVKPTYTPGVTMSNLQEILPDFVVKTLKEGIKYFDKKMPGFASNDAILTGVETRSSSPVQITRNENYMSCSIEGLYPCGEGAGYAGGIMSAAIDGIKCAIKIIEEER